MAIVSANQLMSADAAGRRRVVGHLPGRLAVRRRLRQARAAASSRSRRTGRCRSSAIATRSSGCGSPRGIVPGGGARDSWARTARPARSRWRGCAPERYPVWKALLRDGHGDARDSRGAGRRRPRPHPRGDRRPRRHRRALPDRRALPRDPARSVSRDRRRARIPTCAARLHALVATTARHAARARPRRLQPEEHPDRPRRAR